MKLWRTSRRVPFGVKLMLSYLLLVLAPVIVIGAYFYTSTVNTARESVRSSLSDTLAQTRAGISGKIDEIRKLTDQLYFDDSLQRVIETRYDPQASYETTTRYLVPRVAAASRLTEENVYLSLYYENDTLPEIYYDPNGDPLATERRYDLFRLERVYDQSWYRNMPDSINAGVWGRIMTDAQFGNISFYRKLTDFRTTIPIGLVRVTVKLSDLFHALDYHKTGEGSYLYIADENGRVMYQTAESQNPLPDPEKARNDFLTIREELPEVGWSVVALVPNSDLERSARQGRNLTIAICLAGFLVSAVLGLLVTRYFSVRMRKIVSSLNALQEGEFHERIHYRGDDEFAIIVRAFNDMASNIEKLIHEVYVSNLQKKEAELTALQAQINPHFLYNTLSSISRMAQLDEKEKLHRMVLGLAKFYRLTLNEGKTMIPVGRELEQVKTYIDIQMIKYAQKVEVSYSIDPVVLPLTTVKLILQPMVENALEHAWFGGTIHIRIVAEREGESVVFKVIDNGIGMSRETVRQILNPDGVQLGYGIRNVDERIKLHFGAEYGVKIASGRGVGTTVRIAIPATEA